MDALLRDLRTAPAPALMAVSGAGFISLAASPPATPGLSLCGSLSSVTLADLSPLVMDGRTLGILAVAWLAMVLAMMPLLALQQVRHAMRSSVARRRRLAALLLLTGYALVWMVVGLAMVPLAAFLHAAAHPALILPCIAVALLWSSSPAGGRAHNACHRLYPVAASGPTANRDSLVHGLRTGTACAAACWPWMLAPFAFPAAWHLPVMAAAALLLFVERTGPPLRPAWRPPYVLRRLLHRKPRNLLGHERRY
ncbi:Predicted metal-binding integral membrane protein [Delftia tsuruhatensis]|uniref:copper chaperone n=1 Tax=Delftia tsuruhatensis TaxID=180282 RepID=UPI001E7FE6EF|nr:DUF2182 domain-containing protein [Delftia tsuruhatensis]CAB5689013.1 Predicted metal-binding integral membrane protein [Delftia tsuruhatensis]CAC9691075.1 Predicted metal-binding integral membrane protein [Delftia tsuruhatensis]